MDGPTWTSAPGEYDGYQWLPAGLRDDFARPTRAPGADCLGEGWEQFQLNGNSHIYIAKRDQVLPRDEHHTRPHPNWPVGGQQWLAWAYGTQVPYGYGTQLGDLFGSIGDSLHMEIPGEGSAERQRVIALAVQRLLSQSRARAGAVRSVLAVGHPSILSDPGSGVWVWPYVPPTYDALRCWYGRADVDGTYLSIPPPSGFHETPFIADGSGLGQYPWNPIYHTPIWLQDGDPHEWGVVLAKDQDNCIMALQSAYYGVNHFGEAYDPFADHIGMVCQVYRVVLRVHGVETVLGTRAQMPAGGCVSRIHLSISADARSASFWTPGCEHRVELPDWDSLAPLYRELRRGGVVMDIPPWPRYQNTCVHTWVCPSDRPYTGGPNGGQGESPVHQVIRGTKNFPTSEYSFSGAAARMVDYGTYLDASDFAFSWLGDRSLKIGADVTPSGYGDDYGENHGG